MDTSVFVAAGVAAFVTWIFTYVDAKLFDQPKAKFTYVKAMLFNALLVGTVVFFMSGKAPKFDMPQTAGGFGGPSSPSSMTAAVGTPKVVATPGLMVQSKSTLPPF